MKQLVTQIGKSRGVATFPTYLGNGIQINRPKLYDFTMIVGVLYSDLTESFLDFSTLGYSRIISEKLVSDLDRWFGANKKRSTK